MTDVTLAKSALTIVSPALRGQLARYLDLGEEPSALVCNAIDGHASTLGPESAGLLWWLAHNAPAECWGSREKRLAWQLERAAELAAEWADETIVEGLNGYARDTDVTGLRPKAAE
jgi:hypothetical protein